MDRCHVDIRMLGGFELRDQHGRVLSFTVRKAEAVLALLALDAGRTLTRSKVCGMLWPNVPETQARHSLRQALVAIRKALPQAIVATSRTLALNARAAHVDTADVARWLGVGTREALDRVALAYRGDLLDGIEIAEEPFEQWLTLERERIRAAVSRGLCQLIDLHTAAEALPSALQVSKQVLQLDPLHERTLRTCMRLLVRLGRRAEALQHYHSYARNLRNSLGAQPEAETTQLFTELSAAVAAQLTKVPAAEPPARRTAPEALDLARRKAAADGCAHELRSDELAQLQAAFERARRTGAELCFVEGEAGVGKSHLCEQFAQLSAAHGGRVLRGRCFESEQVLPFACWSDLLAQAHLADDASTLAALPLELRRELARLVPELTEPALLRAADDPGALFHALASVITSWSQAGPLCLVLEDLHWADEMSLRFLCYVTRRQERAQGCLVLASARSEESAAHAYLPRALAELEREGRLSRVPIAPFGYAQTCQLAERYAGQLALDLTGSAWLERIWELSEGNALVVVESAHALSHPEVALDLSRLSLSERMRALIRQRVAALSPNARELASVAAVYGRELQPQLFATFMDETALCAAMHELVAAQLLRAEGERVLFTHDRVRETLYAEMLSATRQLLHGRIAAALAPHASGAALGQAGYHYAKAGNAEAAIALLLQFSEHATRTHALGEALHALDEASQQAQSLTHERRTIALITLAVRQAFCLVFLGRFEDMTQLLERSADVAALVDEPLLAASYHYWHGFGLMLSGRKAQAQEQAARAVEVAARSGDEKLCGIAHNLVSHQHFLAARFVEGSEHAERALELLRKNDESEPLMFAYINVCLNKLALGQYKMAFDIAAHAEHDAQRTSSGRAKAMAALVSGLVHLYLQRWELARNAAQRAIAASKTPFTLGPACAMLALTQIATGQPAHAVFLLESILQQLGVDSPLTHFVIFKVLYAEALLALGAPERARPIATEAVHTSRALDHISLGLALRAQGLAELRLGDSEAARAHLEEALTYYEALDVPIASALSLLALAEVEDDQTSAGAARARAALARAHALYLSIAHDAGARSLFEHSDTLALSAQTLS